MKYRSTDDDGVYLSKDVYSKIKWTKDALRLEHLTWRNGSNDVCTLKPNEKSAHLRPGQPFQTEHNRIMKYKVFGASRQRSMERFAKANEEWNRYQPSATYVPRGKYMIQG